MGDRLDVLVGSVLSTIAAYVIFDMGLSKRDSAVYPPWRIESRQSELSRLINLIGPLPSSPVIVLPEIVNTSSIQPSLTQST